MSQVQHLSLSIDIAAPAERVFAAITDWPAQGEWMLGTTVRSLDGPGHHVGARLEAFTGVGPVGFLDTMTITAWQPPTRVDVMHTGRVVRGIGIMEVEALGPDRSRFTWAEDLELPWGGLGRAGWPLVRPGFLSGVRRSLAAFARMVEAGQLPTTA